jgi:hypothetical protein
MTAAETMALYYDRWQNRRGDLSGVRLADDFWFTGPVGSFDTAEDYRAMPREAGQAVTSFAVRRQFVDGTQSWLSELVPVLTARPPGARLPKRWSQP